MSDTHAVAVVVIFKRTNMQLIIITIDVARSERARARENNTTWTYMKSFEVSVKHLKTMFFFLFDFHIVFSSRELEANIFHSGWLLPYFARANKVDDDQWECTRTIFSCVFCLSISSFSVDLVQSDLLPSPFFMHIGSVFAVKIIQDFFYSKRESKPTVATSENGILYQRRLCARWPLHCHWMSGKINKIYRNCIQFITRRWKWREKKLRCLLDDESPLFFVQIFL